MVFKDEKKGFISAAEFLDASAGFISRAESRFADEEEKGKKDALDKEKILRKIFHDKRPVKGRWERAAGGKMRDADPKRFTDGYGYTQANRQTDLFEMPLWKDPKADKSPDRFLGSDLKGRQKERSVGSYEGRMEQRDPSYHEKYGPSKGGRDEKGIRTFAGCKSAEGFNEEKKGSGRAAAGTSYRKDEGRRPGADPDAKKAAARAQVANLIRSGKLKTSGGDKGSTPGTSAPPDEKSPVKNESHLATLFAVLFSDITIVLFVSIISMAVIPVTLGMFVSIDTVSGTVARMMQGFGSGRIISQASLSAEQIDEIVAGSGANASQEPAIRFALERVGYAYSQAARSSGSAFDCSSLAFYAWQAAGVDLSYGDGYPPTAAVMASRVYSHGTVVSSTTGDPMAMQPGDLIFYGGHDNGRYLGIYHVAIYLGNGQVVEALNSRYGVVYGSVRTRNVILVLRP